MRRTLRLHSGVTTTLSLGRTCCRLYPPNGGLACQAVRLWRTVWWALPSTLVPATSGGVILPRAMHRVRRCPLFFFCDGAGYLSEDGACRATIVLDNLIARGDIPPTCACFLSPGELLEPRPDTNQRGYEYDSITPQFADFLLADVIPAMVSTDVLLTAP